MKQIIAMGAAGVVLLVLALALVLALDGWILMLLLGAVHHSLWAAVPALGYWNSVLLAGVAAFVAGLFRGVTSR